MDGRPRQFDQRRDQVRLKHYPIYIEQVYSDWPLPATHNQPPGIQNFSAHKKTGLTARSFVTAKPASAADLRPCDTARYPAT
jgi:hypothetical protein